MNALIATKIGPYEEVLELGKTEIPTLQSGQILVKVDCCGLAFPDALQVEGNYQAERKAPFIPCTEISGKIIALGEGTENCGLKIGDMVFGPTISGGLAEQAIMVAEQVYTPPSPHFDPAIAAGFELNYGTTYHGLVDIGRLQPDDTLLVLGASGGVGMAAIDIAKAIGANVIACASTQQKLEACEKQGADVLINYSDGDFKSTLKDEGVYGDIDVVFDPVGGALAETSIRAMAWGGRYLVIGFAAGGANPKTAIPRVPTNLALLNERQILGVFWGMWKMRDGNKGNRANIEKMLKLVQDGTMHPTISKIYPLAQSVDAFKAIMQRKVIGKVVVQMSSKPSL